MNIIYKKVDELIPYVNNPRNNDGAVDYVASSIKNFGFKVPIVVDADNEIVTGHTRLKAAKKLGMTEVPVIIADDLTPDQVRAFRLADNKVAEYSTWDEEIMISELEMIDEIDMQVMGFDAIDSFNIEDFPSTQFELPEGDKTGYEQISFTFTQGQKKLMNWVWACIGERRKSKRSK